MAFIHIWSWQKNPDGSDGRPSNEEALEALLALMTVLLPEQPIDGALGGEDTEMRSDRVNIYIEYDFRNYPITRMEAEIVTRRLEKEYGKRFPHLKAEVFFR